ncbi:MAG: hypothetical protein WC526_04135 [Patescibacteria group bacterium]
MRLTVTEITPQEFENIERQIRDSHVNISVMQETWQSLDAFFRNSSSLDDEKFRWTYFRIYTELTWKMFGSQDRDFLVNVAVARQIPMALALDFDVLEQLMQYFEMKTLEKSDMQSLCLKMKPVFLESQAKVGDWQGKKVIISDLIKEMNNVNRSADTLMQADFENKLKQIIYPQNDPVIAKYFLADPNVMMERFMELAIFFSTVDEDNIVNAVDNYLHQDMVEATEAPPQPKVENKKSLSEIKSQISSEFKKNPQGEFTNIEGVLNRLNELSEKYKDPKIAELYYFDEKDGKFKWAI